MDEAITPADPGDGQSIEDNQLVQALVDAGATYVAVAEGPLPDGVDMLVDAPHVARERCFDVMSDVAAVRVDDDTVLPLAYDDTPYRMTHNRVPLYIADGHEALPHVEVKEGVSNLRRAVRGDWKFTPPRDQTVPLEEVVTSFVDAGAVSVTACREMLGRHDMVNLTVGLPTETVFDIAGRYEKITFDGETYPFHVEPLVVGGPQDETFRVGIYYGENIAGIEPKPVEEGLADLRSFIEADHIYSRPAGED